ncbi:MAG: hypothetical protein ACOCPX_02165 [Halapricum sp.]
MRRLAHISDRTAELVGLVGSVSLTAGLLIAHTTPATAYELSIYASTPLTVWISIAVAFLAAAVIAFSTTSGLHRRFGLFLGGTASFSVIALPVMRGYFYHGIHDSITHVGVTRAITDGSMMPYDTIYPGIHTVSAFISGVSGLSVWQATLLVPLGVALVFYLFVPLLVRALVGGELALTVGAFTAFLLVPLHQLATTMHPHPSSQAILFVPTVLFLVIGYLRSPDRGWMGFSALSGIVLLTVVGVILYHPQQALNVILLFVAIGGVRLLTAASERTHRSLLPVTLVSIVAFGAWVGQSAAAFTVARGAVDSLVEYATGTGPQAGSAIGTQSASLTAIGSSVVEIYLKLFLVSTLFIVAAGLLVVAVLLGRGSRSNDTDRQVLYYAAGLVAMLPVFGVYFFGNVGQYYFRQAGFMMLLVSVLGAVAITYGMVSVSETRFRPALVPAVVSVLLVLFLLSSLIFFNSPYIHRANQHVTDARVDGYETAFEMAGDSAIINGIVQEPQRYYDGVVSLENNGLRDGTVNSTEIRNLRDRPADDWYLVVSQNTYERELTAYREHRFTRSDFATLDRQPAANQVFTNGDTQLYFVR